MIKTGDYIIRYYNHRGSKLSTKDSGGGHSASIAIARLNMTKVADARSFTVDRRVFNSLEDE